MSSSRSRVGVLFQTLALGGVLDVGQDHLPLRGPDRGQSDLGGELAAVTAQSEELLAPYLHGAQRGRVHVALAPQPVMSTEPLRHEQLHVLTDQFVGSVAEMRFCTRVGQQDAAVAICEHHRIRRCLDDAPEQLRVSCPSVEHPCTVLNSCAISRATEPQARGRCTLSRGTGPGSRRDGACAHSRTSGSASAPRPHVSGRAQEHLGWLPGGTQLTRRWGMLVESPSGRERHMLLVPRQLQRAGMTGDVPYYGGRFSPAQAYAASHPRARPVAPPPSTSSAPGRRSSALARRPAGRPATSPRHRRDLTRGAPAAAQPRGVMNAPVQVLVVGFDEPSLSGEILAELTRLGDAGVVRLLDVLLVSRNEDGGLRDAAPSTGCGAGPRRAHRRVPRGGERGNSHWRLGPERVVPGRSRAAGRCRRGRPDRAHVGATAGRGDQARGRSAARRDLAGPARP